MSPRCERCDREECRVEETAAALEAAMGGDTELSAYGAAWCARQVCDARAIDWRARALAAEAERDALRDRSEEWESYRYELWAQADDMWRLAWAMMWETIGTHAQYWSCRELLDETTDDRDRLRTQNWGYRVDRDRYWRLAWAAGWAAVGMAVIIWQWAEYRFACSDTPGATRRLDAMLDALDAATMGTIRNAIDAAHGKETT